MIALIGWAAFVWVGVIWAYIAVMHAKAVHERDGLSLFWKVHVLPLAIVGLALDAAFNLVFGTLMFRELPRELLFTARCSRHLHGEGGRQRMAAWWKKQLDQFDENHVH